MERHQRGIILKRYQDRPYQYVVLDELQGKLSVTIDYAVRVERLHVGMLIAYRTSVVKNRVHLSAVDILDMPTLVVQQEFFFLHHLLELCYIICPETHIDGVFDVLLFLFTSPEHLKSHKTQQLFLMRFWLALGMQPEDALFDHLTVCRIALAPLELLLSSPFDEYDESLVRDWLARCTAQFTRQVPCKTAHFVYDNLGYYKR